MFRELTDPDPCPPGPGSLPAGSRIQLFGSVAALPKLYNFLCACTCLWSILFRYSGDGEHNNYTMDDMYIIFDLIAENCQPAMTDIPKSARTSYRKLNFNSNQLTTAVVESKE